MAKGTRAKEASKDDSLFLERLDIPWSHCVFVSFTQPPSDGALQPHEAGGEEAAEAEDEDEEAAAWDGAEATIESWGSGPAGAASGTVAAAPQGMLKKVLYTTDVCDRMYCYGLDGTRVQMQQHGTFTDRDIARATVLTEGAHEGRLRSHSSQNVDGKRKAFSHTAWLKVMQEAVKICPFLWLAIVERTQLVLPSWILTRRKLTIP